MLLQEETVDYFTENGTDPLTISLYQMDLDRTQFLLRSYLRIRLQKVTHSMWPITCVSVRFVDDSEPVVISLALLQIEKHMFHILKKNELYDKLSKQEKAFVQR